MTSLILASSSPFRKELLTRLGVEFDCISPEIDESRHENELPIDYVQRLAIEKAAKIGNIHQDSLIIGSDQCSVNNGEILGKPRDHQQAIEQLSQSSGKTVEFITGVSVFQPQSGWHYEWTESFFVEFRALTPDEIDRYLQAEQPYQCAGSFKSEKLGISLCQSMRGDDPTALIGLPLIRLAQCLRDFGLQIP